MRFGLIYDGRVHLSVDAEDEKSARKKFREAGIMNRSKSFGMKEIDVDDEFLESFPSHVVNGIVSKKTYIPSQKSIKFTR